jgi:flagellar hook-length control protein FliK
VNPAVLSLIPEINKGPSSPALGERGASATSSANAGLFRSQLSQSVANTASSNKTTAPAPAKASVSPSAVLEQKVAGALRAGAQSSEVVTQLAASLANSIATKLGTTDPNARAQLQTAFASALSPPGQTGPPQTTAEQARTLAQRFAKIASIATGVSGSESGQLNRFVGTVLDAKLAKANPAPTPPPSTLPNPSGTVTADSVILDASSAVASLFTAAPVAKPVAVGDGKVVTLPTPAQAIATGGDTPIGRILARATLNDTTVASTVTFEGTAPAGTSPAGSQTSNPDTVVATFLKAFTNAVKTPTISAALGKSSLSSDSPASLLPATSSAHAFVPAFVPGASPLAADVTTSAEQPAPAPPPAAPSTVDANAVVEQLLRGISLRNLGSSSEIRLQLVPEQLGDLSVKLTVSNGNVSAHIIAQNADVHGALVAGQTQLSRSLADAGLKLSSFTVDVSGGGLGQNPQQQNGQPSSSGTRRLLIDGTQTDDADESALLAEPSFAPPSAASASPGALNHLV